MDKIEKEELVSSLRSALEAAEIVVVTSQSGLTVAQTKDLRAKLREAGASFKVAKNTLACIAMKGLPCEVVSEQMKGPTALAYSADPVAAPKVLAAFMKTNDKIQIVCGAMGDKYLDVNAVNQLAKLPSLDELRGRLVGLLQAPATKVAGVLQAPAGQLARVFSAYSKSGA